MSDDEENSVNGEDFKEAINSLRFGEQIDRLRDEIRRVRAAPHDDKKLLIEELQREIEDLIEKKEGIELDEKQEEEVSEEPEFLISNQAKYGTPDYDGLDPEERMINDGIRKGRQDHSKLVKLSDKVKNDYVEIKKFEDLINSGELIRDKEIETAHDKLERDKEEFEKIFESTNPILFKEFKISLVRARDSRLDNASATSRDKISEEIEALQQDIEHMTWEAEAKEEEEEN